MKGGNFSSRNISLLAQFYQYWLLCT